MVQTEVKQLGCFIFPSSLIFCNKNADEQKTGRADGISDDTDDCTNTGFDRSLVSIFNLLRAFLKVAMSLFLSFQIVIQYYVVLDF